MACRTTTSPSKRENRTIISFCLSQPRAVGHYIARSREICNYSAEMLLKFYQWITESYEHGATDSSVIGWAM